MPDRAGAGRDNAVDNAIAPVFFAVPRLSGDFVRSVSAALAGVDNTANAGAEGFSAAGGCRSDNVFVKPDFAFVPASDFVFVDRFSAVDGVGSSAGAAAGGADQPESAAGAAGGAVVRRAAARRGDWLAVAVPAAAGALGRRAGAVHLAADVPVELAAAVAVAAAKLAAVG